MSTLSVSNTYSAGTTAVASEVNTNFTDIVTWANGNIGDGNIVAAAGIDPSKIGDYSANATEMKVNTDPYPASAESLATDLEGELARIRFVLKEALGNTQWYTGRGIQGFTTGDLKITWKTSADDGWVFLTDGETIGNASSGASRANADTSALFTLLWNLYDSNRVNGQTSDTTPSVANPTVITDVAHGLTTGDSVLVSGSDSTPTVDGERVVTVIDADNFSIPVNVTNGGSASPAWIRDDVRDGGTIIAKGADAATDYAANRRLTLPRANSRVLGVAGSGVGMTARTISLATGEETHVLTEAELAAHTHGVGLQATVPGADYTKATASAAGSPDGTVTSDSTGSGTAHNNMQPTLWANVLVKL